jgi:hypothetical protein
MEEGRSEMRLGRAKIALGAVKVPLPFFYFTNVVLDFIPT